MKFFIRIFSYLKKYPGLVGGTISSAILATLLVVVFPAATQQIVDVGIRQHHLEKIPFWIAVGCFGFIFQAVLNASRILLNNTLEQKVLFDLRSDLYRHIQFLPLGWFDQQRTGDIMTRLTEDVASLERMLIDGIEQGSVALLQIIAVLITMAFYSLPLMGVALAPFPFFW